MKNIAGFQARFSVFFHFSIPQGMNFFLVKMGETQDCYIMLHNGAAGIRKTDQLPKVDSKAA